MAPPKDPPKSPIQYTVIVRLPFPRRDFQDPPQVQWDAAKDKKLWKLIARNPKSASGDLDWAARAAEFGVDTPFLLQQAAWLYERHFKHVKEQMTRIRASSAASTPLSGMAGTSIVGSKKPLAMGSRAPSALSIRSQRDSPTPRGDTSTPGTPRVGVMPPLSRTPSNNTVTQSRMLFQQPATNQRTSRGTPTTTDRKSDTLPISEGVGITTGKSSPASSTSDSSTSSDSATENMSRSHTFRRPPRFGVKRPSLSHVDDEEEEDEEPTFVSGQATTHSQSGVPSTQRNPVATTVVRDNISGHRNTPSADGVGEGKLLDSTSTGGKGKERAATTTTESSTGSLSSPGSNQPKNRTQHQEQRRRGLDALSPRRRAELRAVGSPRRVGTAGTQVESDGTPSMGSSFSDLDDASISQSALEEALASNLRHGGASRLSNLSHAFRSRYS